MGERSRGQKVYIAQAFGKTINVSYAFSSIPSKSQETHNFEIGALHGFLNQLIGGSDALAMLG